MKAPLIEVFSSIQGEGPAVGRRHLFVRFAGCHRACRYCDTPREADDFAEVEPFAGGGGVEYEPNPVSVERLLEIIEQLDAGRFHHAVALTGGEPLLHEDFLGGLLPRLKAGGRRAWLETAGDLPERIEGLVKELAVVAMDFKLESVTGEPARPAAHAETLRLCRAAEVEVFVKIVVDAATDESELFEAAGAVESAGGRETTLILQPVTPLKEGGPEPPSAEALLAWQERLLGRLSDVRIVPQVHKFLRLR